MKFYEFMAMSLLLNGINTFKIKQGKKQLYFILVKSRYLIRQLTAEFRVPKFYCFVPLKVVQNYTVCKIKISEKIADIFHTR